MVILMAPIKRCKSNLKMGKYFNFGRDMKGNIIPGFTTWPSFIVLIMP